MIWNGLRLDYVQSSLGGNGKNYRDEFFAGEQVHIACLVGRLTPQKDQLLALETAKKLIEKEPRWRILFVGEKPAAEAIGYQQQVQATCERLGLEDKVVFTGNRSDVLDIIQQSDVLLVTSQFEGFPNVVLEAMGVGTPVISTDYSDIKLTLPVNWQVINDRSPLKLADAILRAYADRESLVKLQFQWVNDNATMEHVAINHEMIYKKCIQACADN